MYTELSDTLGGIKPNNIALLFGSDVRVNLLQGGGRSPLIFGIVHCPEI